MWSIVVVVVFPLLESLGEQVRIVDDFTFEQSVELVGIDAMRALDFAVQARGSRSDLDVSDAYVDQVPVERRAEFLTVVRLDLLDLERQFREDVIDELDRDLLIVARIGAQDQQSRAVIDCGVLVVTLLLSGLTKWLNEYPRPPAIGGRGIVSRSVSTGSAYVCNVAMPIAG